MYTSEIFNFPWILAFIVVVFASFIRGVTGFGQALILAPMLLLMFHSKSVVVIVLCIGFCLNMILLRFAIRHVNFNRIIPLIIGILLGIPLGTLIINIIDPTMLKILIGGITIIFAIPLALNLAVPFTRERLVSGLFGFLSGTTATSTGLPSPPLVLYIHNQKWEKAVVHSSLSICSTVAGSCSLIALLLSGLINLDIVIYAASFIPALLIGLGLGMIAFFRINTKFFRILSMCVVIIAGIMGILSGCGIITLS